VTRRPLLAAFLGALALAVPFIGRAYFVDDHYHLLMARGLLDHPARPYDFLADDDGAQNLGWERGNFPRMVNPPLHHYLMAALLKLSGDPSLGPSTEDPSGGRRIWLVRLGMAAFAALSIPLLGLLARRCLVPPGPVMLLAALTPAAWLSSYALLIDSTMLTFFLGALVAWIEGLKRGKPALLILAGLLMGLTILTKYTGAFVVILAGAYWLLEGDAEGRRRPMPILFLLIPAAVLAGWNAWNVATYGASHLVESSKRVMQTFAWNHILIFLTFFSGVFLFPLASWGWAWRRKGLGASAISVAAAFAVFLASPLGGFSLLQGSLMSLLFVGGILFFAQVLSEGRDPRVKTDFFLLAWLLVGAAQMIYVMQWVAARYYLTILPPAALLAMRAWARGAPDNPHAAARRAAAWAVGMFLFTAGLATADWVQSETSRAVARDAARDGIDARARRCFYLGDSFSSSHLRYAGWRPAFADTPLQPGDLLMHQEVVMPRWWFKTSAVKTRLVKVYEYPSRWPLRVMDNQGAAGFYASAWGALPWTFSRGPLERFSLLEVYN
jgi:4-amino-4-deoxy-L-arabinose transferase-like glycosyltransferase